jgi:2-oxoglutarate dehydrogenase E2 component (dihydrolipoamide succinyltransferase)
VRKVRASLTELGVAPPPGSGTQPPAPAAAPEPTAAAAPAPAAAPAVPAVPAAVPAAAALPQAATEPEPRACFQPGDLQRHAQLQQRIADLQALQASGACCLLGSPLYWGPCSVPTS